jgi:hypothetical protein
MNNIEQGIAALGEGIEYENVWAVGTPYQAGDVVTYNGVNYLAVNDSTGVAPSAVTPSGYVLQDAVTVAGTRLVASKLLAGDPQPAFRILGDGKLEWGPGGATVPDVKLRRAAAGWLNLDGAITSVVPTVSDWSFGTQLAADAAYYRFLITGDGKLSWGPGNAPGDISIWRYSADALLVSKSFRSQGDLLANVDPATGFLTANSVVMGHTGGGYGPYILFGMGDTNLYRAAANVLKTDDAFASMDLVTSLPASPVDGQQAVLTDSLTAPTYTWRFRYNASSASPYKWEFIGGSPASEELAIQEALTTTAQWVDLATVGPSVVLPRAGDYFVEFSTQAYNPTDNILAYIGPVLVGVQSSPMYAAANTLSSAGGAGWVQSFGSFQRFNGLVPGTLRLRYNTGVSGTNFSQRRLKVIPVRVS